MSICAHIWILRSKGKLWVWLMKVFREAQKVNVLMVQWLVYTRFKASRYLANYMLRLPNRVRNE